MSEPATEDVRESIAREAGAELEAAVGTIRHCLEQLSEEQVWWRPAEEMNSIANLILHLCGNLRQWIVSGIGGAEDVRNRPAEFSERGPIPKSELLEQLAGTVAEAKGTLLDASAANLLQPRRIQSFETNGVGAVFHSVSHFRGHTQEIVHLTRVQLGPAYRYAFVPKTPEQGSAG
jgi:hypothetical protein